MTNSIEISAKTKEEAIEIALEQIGASIDDVEIEVIEEGSKGFLGIGGKDATVKVSYTDSTAKRAQKFLDDVFRLLGEDINVIINEENDKMDIELTGAGMGVVIGKRGETLDALQHLTSLVVNRGDLDFVKVSVDTENYREKRVKALESLAKKLAAKVVKSGRSTSLEPMNAYERRIIHATLQDHEYVTTYSVGQGMRRKVVIALKKD
jgi:spoIIIJ-associated protein